jgi:beta-N-acetylhexosaminidase
LNLVGTAYRFNAMARKIALVALLLMLESCSPHPTSARPVGKELRARAMAIAEGLSLEQAAAQVLLVGVQGRGRPSRASLALLERLPVGGVVLFGFNLPDKSADVASYSADVQDAAARNGTGIPLIIALDHEGGSVFRFHGKGITRLPPPLEVGERGPEYARLLGRAAGEELRTLGVNLALAPIVELLRDSNKDFLGNRSYGRDAGRVDASAGAFLEGLQEGGVVSVAKHFPGNAGEDPHRKLPRLDIDMESYERDYLPRFAEAIHRGVGAVMISHVVVPLLDDTNPATLSPSIVTGELRSRLGWDGLAITDDLYMKALSATMPPERSAVEALRAGVDFLMLAAGSSAARIRDSIVRAVESGSLDRDRLMEAARRVIELKLAYGMEQDLDASVRASRRAAFPGIVQANGKRIEEFLRRQGGRPVPTVSTALKTASGALEPASDALSAMRLALKRPTAAD